jgi:choline dehydrogenase-like flavoprotein
VKVGQVIEADVAIIGSGMGGGTLARALGEQGVNTVVIERGNRLPREQQNWDASAVFEKGRYKNAEPWEDARGGGLFSPGVHYWVGGNTKVYGASLPRFRVRDFDAFEHPEGVSPAWPFAYADLEPYYCVAETWYHVHGTAAEDPTEPWRSSDYPYPALPHEPYVEAMLDRMRAAGAHPSSMAMAVDLREGGRCIRCATCDGFPCRVGAKGDAETCGIDRALETGNVKLEFGTHVRRLVTDARGQRVVAADGERDGAPVSIRARTFVVSAGAVNSAALLLRSTSAAHPNGLANSSGLVGQRYMVHNATFMIAIDPRRKNATSFQKTAAINDWYLDSDLGRPLGNVQLLGKLQAPMVKSTRPYLPSRMLSAATIRSVDWYLESEDLPDPDNRITLASNGRIRVHWRPNNLGAHRGLITQMRGLLKRAGFPIVIDETMGIATNSHMCGTATAGNDPSTSVLDGYCRTHDVENLFVVDASFFPSSAALNPALTIAAQAVRVAREGDVLR